MVAFVVKVLARIWKQTECPELESVKSLGHPIYQGRSQYTKSTTINTHVFAYQNKVKYPYAISWELYGGVKTLFYA